MGRVRFSEEQIIGIRREQDAGMKVAEVCREHCVSEPTFYTTKAEQQERSKPFLEPLGD